MPTSGSFHAGNIIPSSLSPYEEANRRRSTGAPPIVKRQSSVKYTTFPTQPPKTPSRDVSWAAYDDDNNAPSPTSSTSSDDAAFPRSPGDATPLPVRQLLLLALLSLSEQTALNSISPYLPTMVAALEEIPQEQAGLYVGILASSFALAQLATNLMWGYMSDVVGRKPVMLLGTSLLAGCFACFGFCTRYWHVLVVHVAMGLLNGNAAVVPTCLGEVTDRSNQSRAFTWLPVMYSIGGITGPALGGLLVRKDVPIADHPFLGPNLGSAALLAASVIILGLFFEETLDDADRKAARAGHRWMNWIFRFGRGKNNVRKGSWSSRWPTRSQTGDATNSSEDDDDDDSTPREDTALLRTSTDGSADGQPQKDTKSVFRQLLQYNTVLVLLTYLVFQLANIGFNSLYPIFASAPPPTGRELSPETIGLLMSFAGGTTIIFQVFVFQALKARLGNLRTYQNALLGVAVTMLMMPFVGYKDERPALGLGTGKWWLYVEIAFVLVIKNICAIGGLSSVLLLITNCAPSHESLGTLNGIAQTLSAAGRSIGPFFAGSLFTLSTHVQPKGEALAWGLFGGIAVLGWVGTLAIRGDGLESGDWHGNDEEGDENGEADEEAGHVAGS